MQVISENGAKREYEASGYLEPVYQNQSDGCFVCFLNWKQR